MAPASGDRRGAAGEPAGRLFLEASRGLKGPATLEPPKDGVGPGWDGTFGPDRHRTV